MSALPPKNRTFVLVKDLIFQEQYKLSHTQTDLMAYIINSLTWAMKIGAYNVISTKKFLSDLPQISESTLEASLRTLKEMELIQVEMVAVPQWKNTFARGIKISSKGLKYNSKFYKQKEKIVIEALEREIRELKKRVGEIDLQESTKQSIEEEKEKFTVQEKEMETLYEQITDFRTFVKTVKKEFGETSAPICNAVKGWLNATKFYINSYNKLSLKTEEGSSIQIEEAEEIEKFWIWLFKNKHRVGNVIDFKKTPTLEELNARYRNKKVKLHSKEFKVYEVLESKKGFSIEVRDDEARRVTLRDKNQNIIYYEAGEVQKLLLHLGC